MPTNPHAAMSRYAANLNPDARRLIRPYTQPAPSVPNTRPTGRHARPAGEPIPWTPDTRKHRAATTPKWGPAPTGRTDAEYAEQAWGHRA